MEYNVQVDERKIRVRILLFGVVAIILPYFVWSFVPASEKTPGLLYVAFLDVGQGDSIFIESPSGTQVLIDGGATEGVLRALSREMSFFDRTIDMVVATHPDQDHIGGLVAVLERYKVGAILMTENKSDTPVSKRFLEAVHNEGSNMLYARTGQTYDFGNGKAGSTTLQIFFPDRDPRGLESNTSSIVAQLIYGETEFMLTGDSPVAIEDYLVSHFGELLHSDVLKAGHHGSRTSTGESFLGAVHPTYTVISAGDGNRYGHPHKEVMEALGAAGVITKNTAEMGSIVFVSDGAAVELR